jgi:hypothetical protein
MHKSSLLVLSCELTKVLIFGMGPVIQLSDVGYCASLHAEEEHSLSIVIVQKHE